MLNCATTLEQKVWEATLVQLWSTRWRKTVMCCNTQRPLPMVYNKSQLFAIVTVLFFIFITNMTTISATVTSQWTRAGNDWCSSIENQNDHLCLHYNNVFNSHIPVIVLYPQYLDSQHALWHWSVKRLHWFSIYCIFVFKILFVTIATFSWKMLVLLHIWQKVCQWEQMLKSPKYYCIPHFYKSVLSLAHYELYECLS